MAFIEPMHRNKPNITYLLFSLICKKRMIPRVNTVSSKIDIAWDYEEIYQFLLAIFYPTDIFKSI